MIGRAGTGVDNVDVNAATKRGIVVVNAPESNSVAAAEHTLALALALCRNVPQAHSSLVGGDWARSRFAGNELYGKTLGVIGFGRIGQLVAHRAQAFAMEVVAYDKFVAAERFRELGVERAETSDDLYAKADIVTIHLPKTPDTVNWIDAEAIAKMKDGVRIVNCARGELVDLEALEAALDSGKVAGAALDVFPDEPFTDHPAVRARQRRRHPAPGSGHGRGAGPRRDDHRRPGAPRAVGRRGHQRGQHRRRPPRGDGGAGSVRAAVREARPAGAGPRQRLGRPDRRPSSAAGSPSTTPGCSASPSWWGSSPATPRSRSTWSTPPTLAEERGIELTELKDTASDEFTELVTVRIESGDEAVEVAGTAVGPRNLPHLVRVWGESFYMPFADHLVVFRYKDQPGMIGRIGTIFGQHGVNIASAAVGAEESGDQAVLALTTDAPVPEGVLDEILRLDGFHAGRAVDL